MPRSNRRCQNCGATETPQWRIGTGGVTLCNKVFINLKRWTDTLVRIETSKSR